MKLWNVKNIIEYLTNREFKGSRITMEEFNLLLSLYITPFLEDRFKIYNRKDLTSVNSLETHTNIMDRYLKNEDIVFSNGICDLEVLLPDFFRWENATTLYNDVKTKVELVNVKKFNRAISGIIGKSVIYFPLVTFYDKNKLKIIPKDITTVNLYYYRKPIIPYLDYYYSNTMEIKPLDEGENHTWIIGEYDKDGNIISVDRAGTLYNSATKELDLDEDLHLEFISYILKNIGVKVKDGDVVAFAQGTITEENTI